MFNNDGNQVQNRRCGGCINPWNHQATPGKTLFAVTIVALAAIATAVGVLSILSALGYNIHVFNVSLKVLGDLTIYGGAAVTFVSFVIFAVGLSWLITRACCRQNRQGNNPNNGGNDNPGNRGNIVRADSNVPPQRLVPVSPFRDNVDQPPQGDNQPNPPPPVNIDGPQILIQPPANELPNNVPQHPQGDNQPNPPPPGNIDGPQIPIQPPQVDNNQPPAIEFPNNVPQPRVHDVPNEIRSQPIDQGDNSIEFHASKGSKYNNDTLIQTDESDSDDALRKRLEEEVRNFFLEASDSANDDGDIHSADPYDTIFKRRSHVRSSSLDIKALKDNNQQEINDTLIQTDESDSDSISEDVGDLFEYNSTVNDANIHSVDTYNASSQRCPKHVRSSSVEVRKSRNDDRSVELHASKGSKPLNVVREETSYDTLTQSYDTLTQDDESDSNAGWDESISKDVGDLKDNDQQEIVAEKPIEKMGKFNDQITAPKKEEGLSILEIARRKKLKKKEAEQKTALNTVVQPSNPKSRRAENTSHAPNYHRNNTVTQQPKPQVEDVSTDDSESDDLEGGMQTVRSDTSERLNTRLNQIKETPLFGTTNTIQPVEINNSVMGELSRARFERLKNQRAQVQQRLQQTQNSAPAIQHHSVSINEELRTSLEKQKAEQSNLSLSNSNNAAQQPVQPLSQRNVREIRRPVIAETGYQPLDLLKKERILRNQPQSCPLLETLNSVEPTKIKIIENKNNNFIGTKEQQCNRQREGFILNMKDKVNKFIGKLTHPDQINTVIEFITKQKTAFNTELQQYGVDLIKREEILDPEVIVMWRDLLEINQKPYLGKKELEFIDKCATRVQPIPKAFRELFTEISKMPTNDTYVANGVYTRLGKALECEGDILFAYSMEECCKAFKLKLQEDVVSLFERTQDTPLTIVDLEKIKLYIKEEGETFFKTYGVEIQNVHEFFIPLYEFADKFQNDIFALFKDANIVCLKLAALETIKQYVQEEQPKIFERYHLKMDIEISFVEVKKFEMSWVTYKKLSCLPMETDIDKKIEIWVDLAHKLPLADDKIWKRYPLIHNKLGEVLTIYFKSNPFSNYQYTYPLRDKDKLRQISLKESSEFLCQKLGCKKEDLPVIEVQMATEGDGEAAQNLENQLRLEQVQNDEAAAWELALRMQNEDIN